MALRNANRSMVERLVRESIYRQLGGGGKSRVEGPNPLVVNVSARHCHLTPQAVEKLFGEGYKLTPMKWLYQEGQYAAKETVTLIGPRSRVISNLRILGPCRNLNQVELATTDAVALGFRIPVRQSGDIAGTPGCMLMGPAGFLEMPKGVIRAAPHVHMHPDDAKFYQVEPGSYMRMRVGGEIGVTFERMFVRVDPSFKLEVHIDTDEGNACALSPDSHVELYK